MYVYAQALSAQGAVEYSRVLFVHEHAAGMPTIKMSAGDDVMELTLAHQVRVTVHLVNILLPLLSIPCVCRCVNTCNT